MLKINLRDIAGFIISFSLLWLTWHQSGINLSQIVFSQSTIGYLGLASIAFLFTLLVHVLKASMLWQKNALATPSSIATSLFIGNFFNVVLPGNLGEALRAWHFHKKVKVSLQKSISGILAEKLVDAQLFVTLLLLLFITWSTNFRAPVFIGLLIILIAILIADILLLIMVKKAAVAKKIWCLVPGKWVRKQLFKTFLFLIHHFDSLKENRHLWKFSLLGYGMFLLNMVQYYFVFRAAGISPALNTPLTLFLVSLVMVVINVMPSAPGSAGVVHYGIFSTLVFVADFSHLPQQPIAFAMAGVYLHLSYFIPESIIGAYFVWRERKLLSAWKSDS